MGGGDRGVGEDEGEKAEEEEERGGRIEEESRRRRKFEWSDMECNGQ